MNEIKEHPILFSTEMVKAVLEGRKTQTRRAIKEQKSHPHLFENDCRFIETSVGDYLTFQNIQTATFVRGDMKDCLSKDLTVSFRCPYGKVGDRLWVRETWADNFSTHVSHNGLLYKATALTDTRPNGLHWASQKDGKWFDYYDRPFKWKPSISMPRAASRITLEITNIRVERLQDISSEDIVSEGFSMPSYWTNPKQPYSGFLQAKFQILWDSINKSRGYSWESNPWVWIIDFKRLPNP